MPVSTASVVLCPKCGTQTATYCYGTKKPDVKIRYRRCPKCENRLKTVQQLDNPKAGEKIVPTMTADEQGKFLAECRAKAARQKGRRKAMKQIKLSERDVAEIKYLIHNNIQTQAYTAMQYGVEKTSIHRIATGACFADIPTPKSLADL
tara:strand:- start:584 stop:1030 length:447 start_codon:yes stop_codon:yes gene_type:complete